MLLPETVFFDVVYMPTFPKKSALLNFQKCFRAFKLKDTTKKAWEEMWLSSLQDTREKKKAADDKEWVKEKGTTA
jgi:hypothetical protein